VFETTAFGKSPSAAHFPVAGSDNPVDLLSDSFAFRKREVRDFALWDD
jgi:hypothetical protein